MATWTWTGRGEPGPHVQVRVRRVAGPDLKFRSRFGLEKPEPGLNWTAASIVPSFFNGLLVLDVHEGGIGDLLGK